MGMEAGPVRLPLCELSEKNHAAAPRRHGRARACCKRLHVTKEVFSPMLKIIISGCNGHMGRVVESLCNADPEVQVAAGFDVLGSADREFPVYSSPAQFTGRRTRSSTSPPPPPWTACWSSASGPRPL